MKAIPFKEIFADFITLLFPNICFNCKRTLITGEEVLCTHCRWDLPETNYHLQYENPLFQKFAYEPKIRFVYSYLHFYHKGVAQKLIHALKYKNAPQVGYELGQWYGRILQKQNISADSLIPVPIHPKRFQERGYNQSEKIADGLSGAIDIPVDTKVLKRTRYTKTQTRRGKVSRWQNMNDVFSIQNPESLTDKNVILVDDVLTTGATLGMIVEQLVKTEVESIGIITLAAGK